MEISELTLKIIIILIPGIIATSIYEKLTVNHKRDTAIKTVINAVLLGVISYLILQGIGNIITFCYSLIYKTEFESYELEMWKSLANINVIPYSEVLYTSIISVFLGAFISLLEQKKWTNKFAQWIKISSKYGDENLYTFFLNSKQIDEIYLRDIKNNLTYHGVVAAYSENDDIKEIVLNDVTVYKYETSEKLYDIERIYISKPKDCLIIETPFKTDENGE